MLSLDIPPKQSRHLLSFVDIGVSLSAAIWVVVRVLLCGTQERDMIEGFFEMINRFLGLLQFAGDVYPWSYLSPYSGRYPSLPHRIYVKRENVSTFTRLKNCMVENYLCESCETIKIWS